MVNEGRKLHILISEMSSQGFFDLLTFSVILRVMSLSVLLSVRKALPK